MGASAEWLPPEIWAHIAHYLDDMSFVRLCRCSKMLLGFLSAPLEDRRIDYLAEREWLDIFMDSPHDAMPRSTICGLIPDFVLKGMQTRYLGYHFRILPTAFDGYQEIYSVSLRLFVALEEFSRRRMIVIHGALVELLRECMGHKGNVGYCAKDGLVNVDYDTLAGPEVVQYAWNNLKKFGLAHCWNDVNPGMLIQRYGHDISKWLNQTCPLWHTYCKGLDVAQGSIRQPRKKNSWCAIVDTSFADETYTLSFAGWLCFCKANPSLLTAAWHQRRIGQFLAHLEEKLCVFDRRERDIIVQWVANKHGR